LLKPQEGTAIIKKSRKRLKTNNGNPHQRNGKGSILKAGKYIITEADSNPPISKGLPWLTV
jgi:hypothetical protein